MSSGRRIDVSSVQVVASVMAAVTGALAASFLGVAGTIIGTAMMSVRRHRRGGGLQVLSGPGP